MKSWRGCRIVVLTWLKTSIIHWFGFAREWSFLLKSSVCLVWSEDNSQSAKDSSLHSLKLIVWWDLKAMSKKLLLRWMGNTDFLFTKINQLYINDNLPYSAPNDLFIAQLFWWQHSFLKWFCSLAACFVRFKPSSLLSKGLIKSLLYDDNTLL